MRKRRLALVITAGLAAAAAGSVVAIAINVATGGSAPWLPAMNRYPLWWTVGATLLVTATGLFAWHAQRRYDQALAELIPAAQQPQPWWVSRPGEVGQVITALKRKGGGTVGITTTLHGAGGFGKTTIAKMTVSDPRLLRRYRGRVHWVTVGRDAGKPALAGLVNDLITQLDPGRTVTFTDARQAAGHLAALLARGPRRLLVIDDVWTQEQLDAFPVAGKCARLVTTRIPSLTAGTAVPVTVDEMTTAQARALLLHGLPPLPRAVTAGLLAETGRWPLLLRLANKILTSQAALGADVTEAAGQLFRRLSDGGVLQADQLTGTAARHLDLSDPDQRATAVRATIEASTSLLTPAEAARLSDLAVFVEDETIPLPLITTLWNATSGTRQLDATALAARLVDLALLIPAPSGAVTMHDVIRDYLRSDLGPGQLAQLHNVFLNVAAAALPAAPALVDGTETGTVTAWWELPGTSRYLYDHLIEHLAAAGMAGQAAAVACDLRWAAARLGQAGPVGPYADLTLVGTPQALRLQRLVSQNAHLLTPTQPGHSRTDILLSRVEHDSDWGPQAAAIAAAGALPALRNAALLPDLPSPLLRRIFTGHKGAVTAVAIAPDGTWLATSSHDGTARIWDTATGQQRAVLTGPFGDVRAVAIAPDGTWLATADNYRTARTWDTATGQQRAVLTHAWEVIAVAIAPDGTWLARAIHDRTARIGDAAIGQPRGVLTYLDTSPAAVAIAPDGTWLATAGHDGTARIWDTATGQQRAVLTGHTGVVNAVAIAPDGTWLATASHDRTARTWDTATGQQRAVFTHHDRVIAVAIAPDGTWLATASHDRTARTWDAATGQQRAVLSGHTDWLIGVAIAPDGTWLATASHDGTARTWDAATGELDATAAKQTPVYSVAFARDGTWLATTSLDATVGTWNVATGQPRAVLTGHTGQVRAVAIAPDGTWLATASDDHTARTWDAATGQPRAVLTGHTGQVRAVTIAPDGTWLATLSDDWAIRIWEATGSARAALAGHTDWVTKVAIAPDGTWLATASHDRTARVWDAATGQPRAVLTHDSRVTAVAIASDSTWLATASNDGTIRIWDATGGARAVMRADSPFWDLAWSPSGSLLAAAASAGLYLYTFTIGGPPFSRP